MFIFKPLNMAKLISLLEAETCSMNIINDECLFVVDRAVCLIKCCIVGLSHGACFT